MKIKIPLQEARTLLDTLLKRGMTIHQDNQKEAVCTWESDAEETIKSIYADTEPLYRFSDLALKTDPFKQKDHRDPSVHFMRDLDDVQDQKFRHQLSVIADMYREVEKRIPTPLEYVDQMRCLRYQDRTCRLEPSSIEQRLTKYMFENHDFGDLAHIDVVAEKVFDDPEEVNPSDKSNIQRIKTAISGVNKKTEKYFGFAVFKNPKGLVGIKGDLPFKT